MQFHPKSRTLPIPLALALVACLPALARAELVEYTAGHADIGVAYEGGQLKLHYHFGGNAQLKDHFTGTPIGLDRDEFDPGEVVVRVPDSWGSEYDTVPAGFGFTGLQPGGSLWILPQSIPLNAPPVPFLGLSTDELFGVGMLGPVEWQLTGMSGPGEFSLWLSPSRPIDPPTVIASTSDPGASTSGDNRFTMPIGTHAHYNFGFTKEGIYDVEFTVTGTHTTSGAVSDTGTFRFLVGDATAVPEPGSLALLGLGTLGLMGGIYSSRRRKRQQQGS